MNELPTPSSWDRNARFFTGNPSSKPTTKVEKRAPHKDIMGTNLWDFIQPLSRQVGTVLKYIWRAGLHPYETTEHDYKIALINLKELNPNVAITVPNWFFRTYQFKKLYEGGEGLAPFGVGEEKATMLYHYTRMLKQQDAPESGQAFYQRQNHYYALCEALEDAIEGKKAQPKHYEDMLGMNLREKIKDLPSIEGNILECIWWAGLKDGVPAEEYYAKALAYLDEAHPSTSLDISRLYFRDVPYKDLIESMHEWLGPLDDRWKATCLLYFFEWIERRRSGGNYSNMKRQIYYDFLRKALTDAFIEASYAD
jgi:hypothetical protein